MIINTPETLNHNLALQYELSWLQANYPEKHELIGLIESHLNTIRLASGSNSFISNAPQNFIDAMNNYNKKETFSSMPIFDNDKDQSY